MPAALQITSLAFSPDGTTLATGDADGALMQWDLAAAKRSAAVTQHSAAVWSLAYSQGDGSVLASGGLSCLQLRAWHGCGVVSHRPCMPFPHRLLAALVFLRVLPHIGGQQGS